jgi:hypothetical protein
MAGMLFRISRDCVCIDAGLGILLSEEGIVDARRHIAPGAKPLEDLRVAGLVSGGEAAGMEVDHQAISSLRIVRRDVEIKFVG